MTRLTCLEDQPERRSIEFVSRRSYDTSTRVGRGAAGVADFACSEALLDFSNPIVVHRQMQMLPVRAVVWLSLRRVLHICGLNRPWQGWTGGEGGGGREGGACFT